MKSAILFGTIFFALLSNLLSKTDEELVSIAQKAFEARTKAGGLTNKKDAVIAFQEPFLGLDNTQRLRALVLLLYDIDKSDPKWSMSSATTMGASYALGDDPDFITDWSPLRMMLKSEKDPRKFYLLSQLAPWARGGKTQDFIAERTHMLFADGRVAKEEGEYTKSYAHDVSEYAYTAITGNLHLLDADFEPPPENLSHEEQAVILAKWLKENWPGCENIKIPARLLGKVPRPKRSMSKEKKAHASQRLPKHSGAPEKAHGDSENFSLRWIIVTLLVAALALFLMLKKTKY